MSVEIAWPLTFTLPSEYFNVAKRIMKLKGGCPLFVLLRSVVAHSVQPQTLQQRGFGQKILYNVFSFQLLHSRTSRLAPVFLHPLGHPSWNYCFRLGWNPLLGTIFHLWPWFQGTCCPLARSFPYIVYHIYSDGCISMAKSACYCRASFTRSSGCRSLSFRVQLWNVPVNERNYQYPPLVFLKQCHIMQGPQLTLSSIAHSLSSALSLPQTWFRLCSIFYCLHFSFYNPGSGHPPWISSLKVCAEAELRM